MTQSTSTIEALHGVIGSVETSKAVMRRRTSPITKTLIASIVFACAYAAFQRTGTTANAEVVEFTRNLAGGFLAVGMTENQPGFFALSALDQDKVDISAVQTSNVLAGAHTVVEVQTPRGSTHLRLRGPKVLLITEQGGIESFDVDWTLAEFKALREAADCSYETESKRHRCGAPFTDLQEAFLKLPGERVPQPVLAFVEPFRDRRASH